MLKKELEEKNEKLNAEYAELNKLFDEQEKRMNEAKSRIWENISYIDEALGQEKNKAKKKMLQGLRDEFQFIYNKLDLNDLPF